MIKALQPYVASFYMGWRTAVRDRAGLITSALILLILITLFNTIYRGMALSSFGHAELTHDQLLWYLVVTEAIVLAARGNERAFGQMISEGALTTLLHRPCRMMPLVLSRLVGDSLPCFFMLLVLGFGIVSLITGTMLPVSLALLPVMVLSALIGLVMFLLCGYMLGTIEVHGPYSKPLNWINGKLMYTFGGLLFPVLLFPGFIQHAVTFTPYPSILGAAANFMLLHERGALLHGVMVQLGWCITLIVMASWVQRRMLEIVLTKGD